MLKMPTAILMLTTLLSLNVANALTSKSHVCNIITVDVMVNLPRVLIKCDAAAPGAGGKSITYFAINRSAAPEAARMILSLATSAKIAGRSVLITYNTDETTSNEWGMGCNPDDCRPILKLGLL
jgi:hypothetical protein